ncbi:phage terminase large subunit family protein [Cetobacterium sp. 2A]|uniref:phage terminase large subunit family protein n=1 Tax=Cetobacterium sp. 2A TaxID=2754723 RepID=UPI00163BD165|nr:terminase gpA endonuclease subunit [Cetobacterium sp. 2A]MBC2855373.1 phage terminase large subunit family protein [Cetobacterium sp. 2A]
MKYIKKKKKQTLNKNSLKNLTKSKDIILSNFLKGLIGISRMNPLNWGEEFRYLSNEGSAEPGKFGIKRTPYMKEVLEKFSQEEVKGVVLMLASQLGKSETMNNIIGWIIHMYQCPTLIVFPTETAAEEYSKERVAPMLRDTPVLKEIMGEVSGTTIKYKPFPGGFLSFRGTGAAHKLASKPICIALCDEIDRFLSTKEGDPITLIQKRLTTFKEDARLFLSGTPTIKNHSAIEKHYLESTQGEWYIPCPECGEYVTFSWERMRFSEDGKGEPTMICPICEIENKEDEWKANEQSEGKWIHKDSDIKTYGYKLSSLASPWMSWRNIVEEYLKKRNDLQELKAFYNTVLAETWDEEVKQTVGYEGLFNRREEYDELPDEVAVIVLAIDTQDTWFQLEYVGYGEKMESWGLGTHRVVGNVSETSTWEKLDDYINKKFVNSKTGRTLSVEVTVIDTGGHYTDEAYNFIFPRQGDAVYGIKGIGGSRPGFNGSKITNCGRVNLISLGVNNLKSTVYARLLLNNPGEGYCHFSLNPKHGYDIEYFKSLTAEIKKINKNGNVVWEKIRPRNESLDIRAYILGALLSVGIDIDEINRRLKIVSINLNPILSKEQEVEIYKGEIDI